MLYTGNGSYRLDVDKSLIDYHQFRSLITRARTHARRQDPEQAVECAEQALALYRGRPLDDLSSAPAAAWRKRVLQDEWLPAHTILLEALLAIGECDQVLARLNDLQVDHRYDMGLAKLRMSALHELARSSEATAYYFDIRHHLLEEGDEQGANHIRQHHESLRTQQQETSRARPAESMPPRQLPRDIVEFVGRDGLLRDLDEATATPAGTSGRVVIVDGMPGVGKTALVVHWAHLARHRFPDGDIFINLNGFADGGAVSQSTVIDDLLTAFGHPPDDTLTLRSRELLLSKLVANRRCLIILDNARNTAHVQDLIALLSHCLIIVTSRQRLTTLSATTGARRARVEPMSDDEGAELLSVRLGPNQQIAVDDRSLLVGLCGGLPLMITLLAEHITSSSAAQLSTFAKQLDAKQLIVSIGEDGDGSTVARTFFSWSYRALDPPEQRLFRLLGLHPGPDVGVELACACDGRTPAETKRSFGILVGAHLLERPEAFDRYRFHDLLREFAVHCAAQDESPEAQQAAERRIVSYYLATATRAHQLLYPGKPTAPVLEPEPGVEPTELQNAGQARFWFDQERTNLTAAVQRAAAGGYHQHAWRLADTVATYLDRCGAYEDSRTIREIAVASAAATGDQEATASSQAGLGMALINLGLHSQARLCLDASLQYAIDSGNERGQASVLYHLGKVEMSRGDPGAAVDLLRRSLDVAQRNNDHDALCWTHWSLGQALRTLKNHDAALTHLHQGIFHAQHIGDKSAHAANLDQIGAIHQAQGDHQGATAYCEQALIELKGTPNMAIALQVRTRLAEIDLERGDAKAAKQRAWHALAECKRTHDAAAEAWLLEVLGHAQASLGETAAAVKTWRRAADLHHRVGNMARSAVVHAHIRRALPGDDPAPT